MPTLLEALEQKYGCSHTSDVESEAELLVSIFVPKRPPRQRYYESQISCRYLR